MEKNYYNINELTNYLQKEYNAKSYTNLQDAKKDYPALFYFDDVLHLTQFSIADNEKYVCYVFQKGQLCYLIASFYNDGTVKNIFLFDEFEGKFNEEEYRHIYSFLPFSKKLNSCNFNEFDNYLKKFNGKYNKETIKQIFNEFYSATLVEDESIILNLPYYQCFIEDNKKLEEIGLSNSISNGSHLIFHLTGENLYIPKQEKNCYIVASFSNDMPIDFWCSYDRFKYRYDLTKLIDETESLKLILGEL